MNMKWLCSVVCMAALLVVGCVAKVTIDKRPNIALPVYSESSSSTNPVDYVIVDQGYRVKYFKFGFNTDIETMSAEITTNKTVNFHLGGYHSSSITNLSVNLEDLLKMSKILRESEKGDGKANGK